MGLGIISSLGTDISSVWERLDASPKAAPPGETAEIPFTLDLPHSQLRRVNRYSKLAAAGAIQAQKDAFITIDSGDPFRHGAIFTTGYGSMVSNISFGESVAGDEPDLCSPTLFAGTVPNSCVGQVCIQLNLKGPSTILVGGNVFLYSKLLINSGKADVIFAGAVEEYSFDLFSSLGKNEAARGVKINEATVVFVLGRARENAYCAVGDSAAAGLAAYPLVKKISVQESVTVIRSALRKCLKKTNSPEVIISSSNGAYFDEAEDAAFKEEAPGASVITGVKPLFGETLGSAFSLNVAVAAMCLKNGRIPNSLGATRAGVKRILATGYDTIGNYHCIMLSKGGENLGDA
ncbi:hypothetical protein AGMMS50276_20910 [Synergistales bacterium]|nr:hypothetical protein AGMMS50276_20910 [Synergistales bacterium]